MESLITSHNPAGVEPQRSGVLKRGRWHAALRWFRSGASQRQISRTRLLTLHTGRVCGLGLVVSALAMTLSAADVWQTHRTAASEAASVAIGFFDARLDDIDFELSELQAELDRAPADACTPAVMAALVRASLASNAVERFVLGFDGAAQACHPDGPGPAFPPPQLPGQRLTLASTGAIAPRLMVTRAHTPGRFLVGVLDSRAFDASANLPRPWAGTMAVRVTLLSADQRPLATLDAIKPGAKTMESLRASARSTRHAVMVQADVDRAALRAATARGSLAAIAAAGLALLVGIGALWSRTVSRSRLVRRIEHGLKKRQFEPYVQPIVDLATGRCAGGEVLMRWAHPQRGMLAPGEFIDEAERTGLIVPMSALVMARAAHGLASVALAHPELYFSFNLTAAQLRLPRFAQTLDDLFHAGTLPRDQVLLELTEREAVDPGGARALEALHAAGWRVAIDDFGTGHSSLASLEHLPIDRIKIDRAFVSTIGEQTASRPVLDAIIALAGQLKVRLIAEGIETRAQWDYLAARGVQYAQGYLIARPLPLDTFVQWLAAQQPALAPSKPVDAKAAAIAPTPQRPVIDAMARQLWQQMRSPGGLDCCDRIHRLRNYAQCFIGRDAVDWLVRHQRVGRPEAVRLGQRLVALGLIRHVLDEHDFADAELFYRLETPVAQPGTALPEAADLRAAIQGPDGVPQRTHARGLVRHRQCSTGREVVDWMVRRHDVPRATALQWSAQLMRTGALRHVFDDQPFRDDRSLYRVS